MTENEGLTQVIQDFIQLLWRITEMEPAEFDSQYHAGLNRIDRLCPPEQRADWMKRFFKLGAEVLNNGFMHQRTRNKPLGYAGDYLVIDWMYSLKTAHNDLGKQFDRLFHRQVAPQAVRNRKGFFCDVFAAACKGSECGFAVLNLASGPGREVVDGIQQAGPRADGSFIHCVDMEREAIAYAEDIVRPFSNRVAFKMEVANVLRLRTTQQYDLIWSAGLFDYLNDKLAVALLRRMWGWTKKGGRMIVGNFHPNNPTRLCMEWCLNWFLLHRTEEDFIRLCAQADIPAQCLAFAREPLGAIIFCTAAK